MGLTSGRVGSDEARAILARAHEAGVRLFDTADRYGGGDNEVLVGQSLAAHHDAVVATKFGMVRLPGGGSAARGSPQYVAAACDASLRRLAREPIDLYYQHRVDPDVPIEETVGAMAGLVQAGKVRWLGLCEASPATIRRAHAIHPLAAVQSEYSLWSREVEDDVLPTCRELGIGFVAYSPIGTGFLSGTVSGPADAPAGSRLASSPRLQPENLDANVALVERLRAFARRRDLSPAQVAVAWVLAKPGVAAIPGASTVRHLDENLAAATQTLDGDEVAALDALFVPDAVAGARKPPQGLALVDGAAGG
ncbi:MAG: aldo/keto reductase, partial [Euzebyales bacterium]|nr:aldo/keto reductase [Euzebyales bacterium]